jgi:soluble lytic murein transglycosylase-like protein
MSVDAIGNRVSEIQAMVAALSRPVGASAAVAPPAPAVVGSAPAQSFQSMLASAVQAPAAGASGSGPTAYDSLIAAAAQRNGVDPALLKALIRQESGFDPNARSSAGATGLVQLMPATAASLGVTDPTDPAQSIDAGARYLRRQLDAFGGDQAKALAAYNAGPGAVSRYGGVPPYPETQQYVSRVLGYAAQYRTPTPSTV